MNAKIAVNNSENNNSGKILYLLLRHSLMNESCENKFMNMKEWRGKGRKGKWGGRTTILKKKRIDRKGKKEICMK